MRIRSRVVAMAAAVMAAAALSTVSATQAQAADTLGITFDADTSTVIAKTGQPVVFPKTALATRTDLQTLTGTLNLPQASANLKLGPLTLAGFTISIINPSEVAGTITQGGTGDAPTLDLDVSQTFQIRIDSVQPLGISTGSANLNLIPAGGKCVTAPTTAKLTGSLNAIDLIQNNTADAHVKGTYTIPKFADCGLFTGLLNTIIAGPNNSLDVHITNPVFDFGARSALKAKVLD